MNLYSYLARLDKLLGSRRDIEIETLEILVTTIGAIFKCEIRFQDDSRLFIIEALEKIGHRDIKRNHYKFQYQKSDGTLIFRSDDSPHHPYLSSFPYHKHLPNEIIASESSDLSDVLSEINDIIYS